MILESLLCLVFALSLVQASWFPVERDQTNSTPIYKDPLYSTDERVSDLLGQMTIQEKVSQITQGDLNTFLNYSNADMEFNATGLDFLINNRGGQVWTGVPNFMTREKLVWAINLAQHALVDDTRLGIPAIFQTEGLHGFIDNGTIFPSPIGMGCSFNPGLVHEAARFTGYEANSLGISQLFAPVLDLPFEQRFGRVEEAFSEDWFLTSILGKSFVDGIQTKDSPFGRLAAATCKHFAAFASPENGLNLSPVHGGERQLRSVYLRAFHHACLESFSTMSSYNSYDGVPVSSSYHIMTEILRNEWEYPYFVITDAGGSGNLITLHKVAATREEAAKLTLEKGLSVEMGGGGYVFETLAESVASGYVNEDFIDVVVGTVLRAKFDMGLFEHPYPSSNWSSYDRTKEAADIDHQLELESIVLLKNDGTLPIRPGAKVALIGPQAGQSNYGDYVFPPQVNWATTALDGFHSFANSSNLTVNYAEGCLRWSNDQSGFDEAVSAAEASDVAVVMVGTWSRDQTELWAGLNATTGEHVDGSDLKLVGAQLDLVKAVKATGVPTVVVFVSGKPVAEPWISDHSNAIVQQFYPGDLGGIAIAEILLGLYNPDGKLSISVPRSVGTLPVYYNYLQGGRPLNPGHIFDNGTMVFGHQYILDSVLPLWSFGHGLSYTNFTYDSLTLKSQNVSQDATVQVSIEITNTGDVDGQEVVQIYFRDVVSTVVTPVKQLVAFSKVFLGAGESKTVELNVSVADMALWNEKNEFEVETGEFIIWGGGASDNLPLNASVWVI